jgi:predicted dehydrogenase
VALADLSDERLTHMKSRYPEVEMIKDYRDFFQMGVEAVVVATPPTSHFDIARDCLEHNLHVLVEKPLTLNSRDAQTLVDIAEARGLTLMVGHTFEYNAAVRALKEIIDSGELGQVYYINAVRLNLGLFQRKLNVLWDLAPHDISIMLYLLGQDPLTISAQGATCIFKDLHDVAYMHLAFPNNVVGHIHTSWLDPNKVRKITVVGSKKMAVYDDVEPLEKIKIYDKGVDAPPYTDTYGDFQLSYRYGDVVIPHIRFTEPLRLECQHFLECILEGKRPLSDGRDGLKVVRILEAAEQSLNNGGIQVAFAYQEEGEHERVAV